MDKFPVIHANSAITEFWNTLRPLILKLQAETDNLKVRGEARYMLRVFNPANIEVVLEATVPVMDDYRFGSEVAQFFQALDKFRGHNADFAVWTRQLGPGKMWAKVTHDWDQNQQSRTGIAGEDQRPRSA